MFARSRRRGSCSPKWTTCYGPSRDSRAGVPYRPPSLQSGAGKYIIIPLMSRGLVIALVLVVLVGGIAVWAVSINNQLVRLGPDVNEKGGQVANVFETVRGSAAQERTVLEEFTKARASASSIQLTPEALKDPKALQKFQEAQSQLAGALSRLLVTVERYPDLKSNQNFLALQSQLEGT